MRFVMISKDIKMLHDFALNKNSGQHQTLILLVNP
jgi:hypothetical protein